MSFSSIMRWRYFFFTFIFSFPLHVSAQEIQSNTNLDLNQHMWSQRVIILMTNSVESQAYRKQLANLQNNREGLEARKLIYYTITPQWYQYQRKQPINNKRAWTKFNSGNDPFAFMLHGLDGGVKLKREAPIPIEDLFALIDGMPMRRAELRSKQY